MTQYDSADMALRGRIGAHTTHFRHDGQEITQAARDTYRASFLLGHACKVCPPEEIDQSLPLPQRERMADHLRQRHFAMLARASSVARKVAA